MFLSNIINTEGAALRPFSKKRKVSVQRKDLLNSEYWKDFTRDLSSNKKIEAFKKRFKVS
jgi:hypothetical protein